MLAASYEVTYYLLIGLLEKLHVSVLLKNVRDITASLKFFTN